ncbi:MAG: hypothetical protein WCK60_00310 [Candidatus Nomurabacteria bacterium]
MVYYGRIPFRRPKSISTGQLVLLMTAFPFILAVLFVVARALTKYVVCPALINTSSLCGGYYNVGMLLIIFFTFLIISFLIFIIIVVKRFSSRNNLKNLSQFQESKNKILQMVKDSNPNITDEELDRIMKQAGV